MRWTESSFTLSPSAPITRMLLGVSVGVYLVQAVLRLAGVNFLDGVFGLSVGGIMQGRVWEIVTYLFLHGSPLHLLLNMLMLYFLGSEVERAVGRTHYLVLYFLSGVLGGLGWLVLTWPYEGVCVGASGAIFGLLGAFAALFPQREVTLLVFFVFPVTLRAWVLAVVLGTLQFLLMISPAAGGVAYSAHLAGGLAGLVYVITLFRRDLPEGWWNGMRLQTQRRRHHRQLDEDRQRRLEVDRLLDKVAQQGLHSLSPAERRQLERASAEMRSR